MFIGYFLGTTLSKKCCQRREVHEEVKKGLMVIWGGFHRREGSNLPQTMLSGVLIECICFSRNEANVFFFKLLNKRNATFTLISLRIMQVSQDNYLKKCSKNVKI